MDNPQEILNTLEGTVERLKVIYADGGEVPLDDNVPEVRQLCISVEEVLRHQQKDKVSFWGDRRDYWNYLSEVVSTMKSLDGCVRRVQGISQLTTGQSKGRALIRECLSEQLLADCIQNSLSNRKRTKEWYHPTSIFLSDVHSQRVLNALYDLSDVTFNLPLEGLELDETWPSFVLKSFQSRSGSSENQNQSISPLLKVLGKSTQVAKVADKDRPKLALLERAVEEEPSEIFIRQEIPFDLELVSSLLADIRGLLTSCQSQSGHSLFLMQASLPELKVAKLDDITSCLSLLKNYITSWSHDLSKKGSKLIDENRALKDKQADLEMQLQETIEESESSETDLINQLQKSREELKSFSSDSQRTLEENDRLTVELSQARDKLRELEAMNFDLEEQLVQCGTDGGEEEGRQRRFTIIESNLQDKTQEVAELVLKLEEMERENLQLQRDLNDARIELGNQAMVNEVHRHSEESLKQLQVENKVIEERETSLKAKCQEFHSQNQSLMNRLEEMRVEMERESEERSKLVSKNQSLTEELRVAVERNSDEKSKLESRNQSLTKDLEELRSTLESRNLAHTEELDELRVRMEREFGDKLKQESDKWASVEQERDRFKAELEEMDNMVEDKTSSLKFKLSSQNIELQQVREHCSKKDRSISELHSQVRNLESQLGEVRERCEEAEKQVEELKLELQDVEGVLHNQQDEMGSLHQQLEEKTLSRDYERASMLRQQSEWDSTHQQQLAKNMELKQEVSRLTTENDDMRRAFKKLLEQKVTLWQHADYLEQEQIAMATWLDSKTITECMSCNMAFTVFARKHHCRSCGKVFCTKCCEKKLQLAVSKDPARVCDNCFNKILQKRTPFAASVINNLLETAESFSSSQVRTPSTPPRSNRSPVPQRDHTGALQRDPNASIMPSSSNSLNIERTVELSGNSLQAKLLVQNPDLEEEDERTKQDEQQRSHSNSLGQSSSSSNSLENTFKIPSRTVLSAEEATGTQEGLASSYRSVNSMEYSVEPDIKQREMEEKKPENSVYSISDTDFHIRSVRGETVDEDYCLIDTEPTEPTGGSFPVGLDDPGSLRLDVSALASKLATLDDGEPQEDHEEGDTSKKRWSIGSGREGCMENTEVMLDGGGMHKVAVSIRKYGTAISWEFSTEPKGIAFGIWYMETKESSKEEEVLPLKRCVSHKATLTGEYCAQKKGVYILKFDNCHSKYSGRKLLYKVWTRPPS